MTSIVSLWRTEISRILSLQIIVHTTYYYTLVTIGESKATCQNVYLFLSFLGMKHLRKILQSHLIVIHPTTYLEIFAPATDNLSFLWIFSEEIFFWYVVLVR